MTYEAELDDRRQEVRRGNATASVVFWPKVLGVGNVTISAPTYSLIDPEGDTLSSSTATITTFATCVRVNCAVDASSLALDENYAAIITWSYGGETRETSVRFDVVLEPWDGSDVSINNLVDEVADIGDLIEAQANQVTGDSGTRSREQQASMLAMKACTDVKQWIRSQLEAKGRFFPRLILNREALRGVVVAQTIARAYRAQGGGRDSPARALAEDWTAEAKQRLAGLGELDYDEDEDRVADTVIGGWSTVKIARSWA